MGSTFVLIFLAVFVLAIGQAILRRLANPYAETPFGMLPAELQAEVARVLPGFVPGVARITRKGDEVRAEGQYLGEKMRIEADFDAMGRLVEFEAEAPGMRRVEAKIGEESVSAAAREEIERVIGAAGSSLERARYASGRANDEAHFEVRGIADGWKWEVAVSESGRLLEVEREQAHTG
jgi:hypothetical protein